MYFKRLYWLNTFGHLIKLEEPTKSSHELTRIEFKVNER